MFKGQRICQKLAIITTGAALSLAVIEINPAQAITITYEFGTEEFSGKFSYDDANETRRKFFASIPDFPVIEISYPVDKIEFFSTIEPIPRPILLQSLCG
ncbi:MAG: hypothetical protein F6K37_19420 [Moorea sp. SIO4E2]|uniref:hypothetical protein n=1 Tax=Moorena sp. SIO4E2 TaxID=2607826 RepID=UPI0013B70E0B|nr:hypothetical protein [Moorena sp. SIO4E2]NEQ08037.1 hypothetical protein [Moorena sp. SIO4E2]